jgi:hypothetical protein
MDACGSSIARSQFYLQIVPKKWPLTPCFCGLADLVATVALLHLPPLQVAAQLCGLAGLAGFGCRGSAV